MIKVVTNRGSFLIKGDSWEMEEGINALVLNVTMGDENVVASFQTWDYVLLVDDGDEKPVEEPEDVALNLSPDVLRGIDEFLKDPSTGVLYERPRRPRAA